MNTRIKYIETLKKQFKELNRAIDILEQRSNMLSAAGSKKNNDQFGIIRAKYNDSTQQLEIIQSASDDTWESLKKKTELICDTFRDSVVKFVTEYR